MAKNKKTNAMRMLDRAKIKYEVHSFEVSLCLIYENYLTL